MNNELIKSLEEKSDNDLFDIFKHDGSITFMNKLIAGKLLNERGFDKAKLSAEKNLIIKDYESRIIDENNNDLIKKKNSSIINSQITKGAIFFTAFLFVGLEDFIFNNEAINYTYLLIMLSLGIALLTYKLVNYKKQLHSLINSDLENNELLRHRLQIIETDWAF